MSSTPEHHPSEHPAAGAAGPAGGETALLARVQRELLSVPGALPVATGLSHLGEHALGWFALAGIGMVVQPQNRGRWAMVGAGTFSAHAASVLVKRIVRRRRPDHPSVRVGVATPSALSFPSSHATSTTAFALLAGSVTGVPVAGVLAPVMMASRLALGVHYPVDVLAGAALGSGCAATTRALWPRPAVQRMLPPTWREPAGPLNRTSEETR